MENLVKSLFSQIDKLNEEVKALKRENKRLREKSEDDDDDEIQVIESTPKRIKREVDQHWIVSRYIRMVIGKGLTLSQHQDIGKVTKMLFRACYRCSDNSANLSKCNPPLTKDFLPAVMNAWGKKVQQYEDSDCHLIERSYRLVVCHNRSPQQVLQMFISTDWHRIDKALGGSATRIDALLG